MGGCPRSRHCVRTTYSVRYQFDLISNQISSYYHDEHDIEQVFPCHVAERLKNGESVVAEAFDCVTILFADIVGFTKMSTVVKTGQLFDMLNRLYTRFDDLVDQHGVFKVDTIGDGTAPLGSIRFTACAPHPLLTKSTPSSQRT